MAEKMTRKLPSHHARLSRIGALLSPAVALLMLASCGMPASSEQLLARARHDFDYGRVEQAEATYRQVLERWPGDPDANIGLAECLMASGQPGAALLPLQVAAAERPRDFEVAKALAEAYALAGERSKVYQLLRDRAVEQRRIEAWLLIGEYALRFDDPDTAGTAIATAIELSDGRESQPYLDAAKFAERIGDQRTAIRRLRQAYGIDPDDPRVIAMLREYGEVPGPTIALPPGR